MRIYLKEHGDWLQQMVKCGHAGMWACSLGLVGLGLEVRLGSVLRIGLAFRLAMVLGLANLLFVTPAARRIPHPRILSITTGSIYASHCVTQPIYPMTTVIDNLIYSNTNFYTAEIHSHDMACCVFQIASQRIASNLQKFHKYLSNSLNFPRVFQNKKFPEISRFYRVVRTLIGSDRLLHL